MNSSVLWIASSRSSRPEIVRTLRERGLLPVRVESVNDALHLLKQFRAGVVVYHADAPDALAQCARLAGAGSPVVAIAPASPEPSVLASAGCAAVIGEACTDAKLVELLRRVVREGGGARLTMQRAELSGVKDAKAG